VVDFVTQDGALGVLAVSFRQMAEKAFSGRDEPPFVAPAAMSPDLDLLASHFCSIGVMYARMPVPAAGTAREAANELVVILRPLVQAAESAVRRLTASMVDHLGGSGERYLLARHLDPMLFAAAEREALKKATLRAESTTFGSRRTRPSKTMPQMRPGVFRAIRQSREELPQEGREEVANIVRTF
jgi:hypothetical protein